MKKKKNGKRIASILALIFIALTLAGLLIACFTHAAPGVILSFLMVLIAVPFIFYACITYLRHKEQFLKDLSEKNEDLS